MLMTSCSSDGDSGCTLWWTSSTFGEDLLHRSLWNEQSGILQAYVPYEIGASIRCIQDC